MKAACHGLLFGWFLLIAPMLAGSESTGNPAAVSAAPEQSVEGSSGGIQFFVIPIRGQIGKPTLYVVRTGVKEAIERGAQYVVLDMDTGGGDGATTFEIMSILHERFKGRSITFVNTEAGSAGALIAAATHEIYFAPLGVMGAAEPVSATGENLESTMHGKVVSFMQARIRALSSDYPYRGAVLSAMMDRNFELKIGEKVIKAPSDKPLTLTADEAVQKFGEPPEPLLASGIATNLTELCKRVSDGATYEIRKFEITWSINLAQWLTTLSPILLGLGGLLLYIEFKTPGFGIFGVSGICLLLLVFFGHNLAGLSGHEPVLVFLLGVVLVFVELLFFPGTVFVAVTGVALMFASLLWGMADIWPQQPIDFSGDFLVRPLVNLGLALVIAVTVGLALVRFLPRGWFFERLAIGSPVSGKAQSVGAAPDEAAQIDGLVGRSGIAVTGLFPSGQVEIDGRRYEARVTVASVPRGAEVTVVARSDFGVIVEAKKS